jgi:hypothetical protein
MQNAYLEMLLEICILYSFNIRCYVSTTITRSGATNIIHIGTQEHEIERVS